MIDLQPTKCNLCGGEVVYISNAEIYGKEYGSGRCYFCVKCKAYVGTHKPRPFEALGILANAEMRELKIDCHNLFDKLWQSKLNGKERGKSYFRNKYYGMLALELGIKKENCHFGYFDLDMLKRAHEILTSKQLKFKKGKRKYERRNV